MIKFMTAETPPTFKDVEINKVFVDGTGYLCQKTTYNSYNPQGKKMEPSNTRNLTKSASLYNVIVHSRFKG